MPYCHQIKNRGHASYCSELDNLGFWSIEAWGGATFDACVRYLREDPWDRLRKLRNALPNSRIQMLLRGQNLLGYRHYSDDVVDLFVKKSADNGVDVFRIFDAMNDLRNIQTSLDSVKKYKKQKIKNIVILDSLKTVNKDAGFIDSVEDEIDSLKTRSKKDTIATNNNNIKLTTLTTTGITICETDFTKDSTNNSKSTEDILEVIETTGELAIEGDINFTDEIEEDFDDIIMGYIVEQPPKFKEAKNLTQEKANKDFNERIQHFIQENFDTKLTENLDLAEGKYRVFTQFIIDKYGNMTDIKVKAPHPKLKNEVFKMLQKLPQLIPATQAGKAVKTKYTLPISFVVE